MGVIYDARDPRTGRRVALKLLLDASPRFRERFARESQLLARLNHPNVVRVHDAGEAQGKPYIVMEFVEGATLEAELRRGPLEPQRAAQLVASVARGVGHAHAQGLVHRDIKPENVLLRPDGQAVLTDFGLARDVEVSSELSKTGIFMGTPGYASPEQAQGEGKRVGPASDVYGLGALLFALLCARPPRTGTLLEVVVQTLSDPAPSPRAHNPSVDPTLDALCRRCMAKDPAERYPDGDSLADALEAYLSGELSAPPRGLRLGYVLLGALPLVVLLAALQFALSAPAGLASPTPEATSSAQASATPDPPPAASSPGDDMPLEPDRALTRALSATAERASGPREGEDLDAAIEVLIRALERAGPASNRPLAERRLAELYTRRSESLFQRSPEQVAADLRAAIALDRTQARLNALAQALLGQALVQGGDLARGVEWERVQELYREAMALAPDDPRPALVLGEQARSRKDWETCLSANEEAARRAPADELAPIQIARALEALGRGDEAFERLQRFLTAHAQAQGPWRELGDMERRRGRWGRARHAYEQAGGEESERPGVLAGLSWVALEEGRHELALELCERASTLRPLAVRALARHRTGDPKGALADFDAAWGASTSDPILVDLALGHLEALRSQHHDSDARLRFFLAEPRCGEHTRLVLKVIHYGSTDRHPLAQEALRALLQTRELVLEPRADCALSEWLTRWGTYDLPDLALKLVQRAGATLPSDEDAAAYTLAGRALMRLGRHDEAWSALDAALAIHPTRADLHHVRAELGAGSHRYELGLESGRRTRELHPTDVYVCIYMTWSLLALGRGPEAVSLMDFVESKLGNSAAALHALVRACAGEVEVAREGLARARLHDPKSREIQLTEAVLLLQAGAREPAIKAFEQIQTQRLGPHEVDFILDQLKRAKQP